MQIKLHKTFEQLISEKYIGKYIVLDPKYKESSFCMNLDYRQIIGYDSAERKLRYIDGTKEEWRVELTVVQSELEKGYIWLSKTRRDW
jgi:hypothetical protein